ncbi:hypothetical protein ES705_31120 [subsurface metagenome]
MPNAGDSATGRTLTMRFWCDGCGRVTSHVGDAPGVWRPSGSGVWLFTCLDCGFTERRMMSPGADLHSCCGRDDLDRYQYAGNASGYGVVPGPVICAAYWLCGLLADGPRRASDVRRLSLAFGLHWRTVERAKPLLEVGSVQHEGCWWWLWL